MRLYRFLLHLYPSSFRDEYGEEMVRLFAERRRDASLPGRVALHAEAVSDALATAPRIHIDILRQDLRYTFRMLARSRGFAIAAVLVMALGIGASTAVFSIADRVLLRPLPFEDPDTIVRVWENAPGYPQLEPSPANYRDWTQMTHRFHQLEAHTVYQVNMKLSTPERVEGVAVTGPMLPMLGVQPSLGRFFTADESRLGGHDAVILSDRLWRRAFNADPNVLGRPVRLDDTTYTIVGVMPPDFYFPDRETELWVPLTMGPGWYADRDNNALRVVGRLKPGVSLEDARTEMNGVMAALEKAYPKENAQTRATVRLFSDQVGWRSQLLIRVLIGGALCLLLIACTNLATLLLTRLTARRRELAVRAALGAGAQRLTRQLLTESLVLAAAGGGAGILLAIAATPLLERLVPTTLPVPDATVLDARVLLFAVTITLVTGILFGVLPAWRVGRSARAVSLPEGARGDTGGRERVRRVLVAAQITASILLLICTGLLGRALWRVQGIDPGFSPAGVLTLRTALPTERYLTVAARSQFYDRVLDEVRALPGVEAAAYTSFTPLIMRGGIWAVEMPGLTTGQHGADVHTASLRFLTPGYFDTLSIPIRQGRDFTRSDTSDAPFVAIVSESFAKRYWPDGDAIGRRFTISFFERTIVGVAADVRVRGLESDSEPQVYVPNTQIRDGWMIFYWPKDLLVRTTAPPMALVPRLRRVLSSVDPEVPLSHVQTLEEVLFRETAPRRTQMTVLGLFAAMALLLAGVGVHGLLSFAVSQRHREIGVRIALGAPRHAVVRLVAGESVVLAAVGAALGMGLAYLAGRYFESILAGVRPADPLTFGIAALFTCGLALSGSLLPTLRAVRVDPCTALRAD
jgi:putative ABC transport system permease protein